MNKHDIWLGRKIEVRFNRVSISGTSIGQLVKPDSSRIAVHVALEVASSGSVSDGTNIMHTAAAGSGAMVHINTFSPNAWLKIEDRGSQVTGGMWGENLAGGTKTYGVSEYVISGAEPEP